MTQRPRIVSLVALFLGAATGIAAAVAISLLLPGTFLDRMWQLNPPAHTQFTAIGRGSGILIAVVGAATASAAVGLLRRKRWAWQLSIAVFFFNGIGDAINLLLTGDLLKAGSGALVAAVFLFALLRPNVRAFFRPSNTAA